MSALNIGWIGDSITAGTFGDPVGEATAKLLALGFAASSVNRGVAGSTTADWAPGGGLLTGAKAAFVAAGTSLVHVMLGTNDARTPLSLSPTQHAANMAAIVGDLTAAGYAVVISKPLHTVSNAQAGTGQVWPAVSDGVYQAYFALNMRLADGARVFQGDTAAFALTFLDPTLLADGIHASTAFNTTLGDLWATAILQRFGAGASTSIAQVAAGYRGGFVRTGAGYRVAPAAVSGLAATAGSTSVALSWSEPGEVATARTVTYRRSGSSAYVAVPGGSFGASGGTVTGLSPSTAYDFSVVEGNPAGVGAAAAIAGVQTAGAAGAPGQVGALTAGAVAADSIAVSYSAASGTGPISYSGAVRVHGGSAWTGNAGTFTASGGTFTGLSAGTSYDLRVVAGNAGGSSTTDLVSGVSTRATGRVLPTVAAAAPSVWFDASRPGTVFADAALQTQAPTMSGQAVMGLVDSLGSGRALVQASAGAAPSYAIGKAGGRNMLLFGGAQVLGTAAGQAWVDAMQAGKPFTARLVVVLPSNGANYGIVSAQPAGAAQFSPGTDFHTYGDGLLRGAVWTGGGGNYVGAPLPAVGTVAHVLMRYDGSTIMVRSAPGSTDGTAGRGGPGTTLDQLLIGTLPGYAAFTGWFGEFALWPGAATSAEADALLSEAASWWGA